MSNKFRVYSRFFISLSLLLGSSCIDATETENIPTSPFSKKSLNDNVSLYQKNLSSQAPLTSSEVGGPKPNTDFSKSVPDSTPYLNLVDNPALKSLTIGNSQFPSGSKGPKPEGDFSTKTCCGSGATHWGARIAEIVPAVSQWGVYGGHKINVSQTFNAPDTLVYSPTTMPPNNAPLEVVTVYYRAPGQTNTQRMFGVWDHTGIHGSNWIIYKSMSDADFYDRYTKNFTDGRFYFFQILKTSATTNTWTVQLYNFLTNQWENQAGATKSFPLTFNTATPPAQKTGWGFHEPKFDDICPSLSPIKLSDLRVWNGSTWYDNTPSKGSSVINGGTWCSNWGARTFLNDHFKWTVGF